MKTIIAGSRSIKDFIHIERAMSRIAWTPTEIVSGTASGVDTLGEEWACERDIPIERFPADWKQYGKSAGFIRNRKMAEYADALVAIHDGKSRGTQNMIDTAFQLGLKVFIYRTDLCRVVHCKKESYDVYCGRPSKWGNPFELKDESQRDEVIEAYRQWLPTQPKLIDALPELQGKVLACWCHPKPCHCDVLAEVVNHLYVH